MSPEPSIDIERLIAAGVYDPASPRAADRLELVTYLVEHGTSQRVIEETFAAQGLNGLIEQLQALPEGITVAGSIVDVFVSPERLSATEIAERVGVSVDLVVRVRAELGFRDEDPNARVIPAPFVDDMVGVVFGSALFGEERILGLVRVLGSTAIRLAEAARALVFTDLAADLIDKPGGELEMLKMNQQATGALPLIPAAFTRAFFEHVNRLADVMVPTDPQRLDIASLDVAVAFVDLVASTGWTEQATRGELRGALGEFERLANTLATEHGCRLVKTNGDDAMFVGFNPTSLCALVLDLCAATASDARLPAARGGVAFGTVFPRDGDYFGPPVNIAARAGKSANPGSVVVTAAAVDRMRDSGFTFVALGPTELRGVSEPVELFDVSSGDGVGLQD